MTKTKTIIASVFIFLLLFNIVGVFADGIGMKFYDENWNEITSPTRRIPRTIIHSINETLQKQVILSEGYNMCYQQTKFYWESAYYSCSQKIEYELQEEQTETMCVNNPIWDEIIEDIIKDEVINETVEDIIEDEVTDETVEDIIEDEVTDDKVDKEIFDNNIENEIIEDIIEDEVTKDEVIEEIIEDIIEDEVIEDKISFETVEYDITEHLLKDLTEENIELNKGIIERIKAFFYSLFSIPNYQL